jgi:hypothetical protein
MTRMDAMGRHGTLRGWGRRLAIVAAAGVLAVGGGCSRSGYSQETPEDVLATARAMVEKGDAKHLTELFYAQTPEMRDLYRRLGRALGHMQDLALAIQKAFPKETDKLKAEAVESAKKGDASSFIAKMLAGAGGGGRKGRGRGAGGVAGAIPSQAQADEQRKMFDNAAKQFFADPFGWLERGADKVGTVPIADDVAAVTWDGKPAFAPIGLTMQKDGGKWFVVPPTNIPGVSNFMPQTPGEYKIAGSLMVTFDKVVLDLTDDVKKGRIKSLEQVGQKAGEKAFIPAAMVVFAYGKMMEERGKAAKAQQAAQVGTGAGK